MFNLNNQTGKLQFDQGLLCLHLDLLFWRFQMASIRFVAQLDASQTGYNGVAGSIPAGSGNIRSRRLIMK